MMGKVAGLKWKDRTPVMYEQALEVLAAYFGDDKNEVSEDFFYIKLDVMQRAVNWYERNYGKVIG